MDVEKLRQLLNEVKAGQVSPEAAFEQLRRLPFEDLGFAEVDTHRAVRKGLPEVVLCQNKTPQQVAGILEALWRHHDQVMGTRVSEEMAALVQARLPAARYDPISRMVMLSRKDLPSPNEGDPYAVVVSAGTSDMPVAEEAAQTLEFLGDRAERAYDVGVSGLHRLLDKLELLLGADVVISVAGMEGALTSVVGGLVACPVIGVPTSVGYGASFGGLAALLAMLNSCASGVTVVNIDNGFGAGQFAHLILQRIRK
ncbi:MAG TPA: nickel pincer cofactor biosynthesis protein LarB [Anaerolineales bacterium]|jgi:NCAIR mutase (PurE)-related protein|nr:nickel pincer cofactor biosynthesis protein LarB [Anaerolineales bacterium]